MKPINFTIDHNKSYSYVGQTFDFQLGLSTERQAGEAEVEKCTHSTNTMMIAITLENHNDTTRNGDIFESQTDQIKRSHTDAQLNNAANAAGNIDSGCVSRKLPTRLPHCHNIFRWKQWHIIQTPQRFWHAGMWVTTTPQAKLNDSDDNGWTQPSPFDSLIRTDTVAHTI